MSRRRRAQRRTTCVDADRRATQRDLRGRGRSSVPGRPARAAAAARCARSSTPGTRPRARVYRQTYEIPDDLGTAVNVMQMVFGNKGDDCATGVCFSRDPSTGERGLCGEFLVNAQGEDVVAGIRMPRAARRHARAVPRGVRRARADRRPARAALPRRPGHRVHRRARVGSTSCRPGPPSGRPPPP